MAFSSVPGVPVKTSVRGDGWLEHLLRATKRGHLPKLQWISSSTRLLRHRCALSLSLVNEEIESPMSPPSILFIVLFVLYFDDKNQAKLLCLVPTAPSTLSREFKSAFTCWHAIQSFTKMGRYFSFWCVMEADRLLT
jgi:hypothetical protein